VFASEHSPGHEFRTSIPPDKSCRVLARQFYEVCGTEHQSGFLLALSDGGREVILSIVNMSGG
jgi:hypothetical protein